MLVELDIACMVNSMGTKEFLCIASVNVKVRLPLFKSKMNPVNLGATKSTECTSALLAFIVDISSLGSSTISNTAP